MNSTPPQQPDAPLLIDPTMPPAPPSGRGPAQPSMAPPANNSEGTTRPRGKAVSRSTDPVLAYQFSVEVTSDPFGIGMPWDFPIDGFFTEISGLDVEWETSEYKSTNLLGIPHSNFLVGRPVYHPLVLKRGITDTEGFWLWHQLMALGTKPLLKRYVLITMYNRSYEPIATWSVERAFPSKISGPQIRSDSSDFVIEEMTLTHGGIHREYFNGIFTAADLVIQAMLP